MELEFSTMSILCTMKFLYVLFTLTSILSLGGRVSREAASEGCVTRHFQ